MDFFSIFSFFLDIILFFINIFSSFNGSFSSTTLTPRYSTTKQPLLENCSFVPNSVPSNQNCSFGYNGQYCDECGLNFKQKNVKIVGGVEAVPNSWPFIAYLSFDYEFSVQYNGKNYTFTDGSSCGGTLIDRETVITASHCFSKKVSYKIEDMYYEYEVKPNQIYPTFESMYTVYLGLHNYTDIYYDLNKVQKIKVRKFILHPNYDDNTYENDIAIIKLETPATLNCDVQIACLPNPSIAGYPTSSLQSVFAAGWGVLSTGGPAPNQLQNVELTLYDGSYCSNVLPKLPKDWSKQICAGNNQGGQDTCQGDSGGPLVLVDNVNGKQKFILIGVVSYGDGCASVGLPGIYIRMSAYLNWINQY